MTERRQGTTDTTNLPGLKSGHQIITPECRANRTTGGAWDEAVARLRAGYDRYAPMQANKGVRWHLVLVREEPDA